MINNRIRERNVPKIKVGIYAKKNGKKKKKNERKGKNYIVTIYLQNDGSYLFLIGQTKS